MEAVTTDTSCQVGVELKHVFQLQFAINIVEDAVQTSTLGRSRVKSASTTPAVQVDILMAKPRPDQ